MDFHPDAETSSHSLNMQDSGDSEEESNHEEPPVTSWSELSIIERVGLSSVDMSEKDLETAFCQISLAFRCDQYTLKQRLQAEEHARNVAEENIQLELSKGRETLETLKGLCLDHKRSSILQKLELSLDVLSGTVERVSNTAEVLGAVHQEARVSQAVELMVAHVESLRRRHDRHEADLNETKKTLQQQQQQQNVCRSRTFTDSEGDKRRKGSNQSTLRRRISASLIPIQTQEKKKGDSRKRSSSSKKPSPECLSPSLSLDSSCSMDDDRQQDPDGPAEPQPEPSPNPEILASEQVTPIKTQTKNPSVDDLQQKHTSKSASSNRKKGKKVLDSHTQNPVSTIGWPCKQHPTLRYRCRWVRTCSHLLVLLCAVVLMCCLWKLYDGELEL